MEQKEKRESLIRYLLNENERLKKYEIPENEDDQKKLLRTLINVRMPVKADEAFLEIMDSYLQEENFMNMVNIDDLDPVHSDPGIILWQGDITRLNADAIVSAANSGMTGCYQPLHNCIDNPILN